MNLLNEISNLFFVEDLDSAVKYAQKGIQISRTEFVTRLPAAKITSVVVPV